jgi:DnaJ-domain-containing protein 1
MTGIEIGAIVSCLVVGYWGTSALLKRTDAERPRAEPFQERPQQESNNTRQEQAFQSDSAGEDPSTPEYARRNWYRILGVAETATGKEISAAYKQLISQYHPDKVSRLGEELRDLAEYKSKQINIAYKHASSIRP